MRENQSSQVVIFCLEISFSICTLVHAGWPRFLQPGGRSRRRLPSWPRSSMTDCSPLRLILRRTDSSDSPHRAASASPCVRHRMTKSTRCSSQSCSSRPSCPTYFAKMLNHLGAYAAYAPRHGAVFSQVVISCLETSFGTCTLVHVMHSNHKPYPMKNTKQEPHSPKSGAHFRGVSVREEKTMQCLMLPS